MYRRYFFLIFATIVPVREWQTEFAGVTSPARRLITTTSCGADLVSQVEAFSGGGGFVT